MKFPILLPNIFNYPFTYESDIELKIVKTDQHQLSTEGQAGGTQFLSIFVKIIRDNSGAFTFMYSTC